MESDKEKGVEKERGSAKAAPKLMLRIPSRTEIDTLLTTTSALQTHLPRPGQGSLFSPSPSPSSSSTDLPASASSSPSPLLASGPEERRIGGALGRSSTTESVVSASISSPSSSLASNGSDQHQRSLSSGSVASHMATGASGGPKVAARAPIVIPKGSTSSRPPIPLLARSSSGSGPRLLSPPRSAFPTPSLSRSLSSSSSSSSSSALSASSSLGGGDGGGSNLIFVNKKQERNPVLSYIRAVRWTFIDEAHSHEHQRNVASLSRPLVIEKRSNEGEREGERGREEEGEGGSKSLHFTLAKVLDPDFVLSPSCCALFLSVNYHISNPQYLSNRIRHLPRSFTFRIILCLVDTVRLSPPRSLDLFIS